MHCSEKDKKVVMYGFNTRSLFAMNELGMPSRDSFHELE